VNRRCISEAPVVRGGYPPVNHTCPKAGVLADIPATFGQRFGRHRSDLTRATRARAPSVDAASEWDRFDLSLTDMTKVVPLTNLREPLAIARAEGRATEERDWGQRDSPGGILLDVALTTLFDFTLMYPEAFDVKD
jgi:hypothetical protein